APLQVVEVDVGANPVPDAADGDDPVAWCFEHALEEESGESEMPEVIGAELHLEPVGGELFGRVHDAGGVDAQGDPQMLLAQLCSGLPARGEVGEVELRSE